jgi:hypothetical protein
VSADRAVLITVQVVAHQTVADASERCANSVMITLILAKSFVFNHKIVVNKC